MTLWSKRDYENSASIADAAEAITKRLTEHAVRLAITRFDLLSFDPDGRDEANSEDDIVQDIQNVAMGEDTGCLDPDDLDATNCEVMFVEAEIRKLLDEQATLKHLASALKKVAPEAVEIILNKVAEQDKAYEEFCAFMRGGSQ